MTFHPAILLAALLLAFPLTGTADAQRGPMPPPPPPGMTITQFSIHEHIVIRMPISRKARDRASPIVWKEKRGPKCIAAATLGGALIAAPSSVDLVLTGGERVRAKLDGDCQPLDFYAGFYIKPGADGQVCADRDSVRVRSGSSCQIDSFKRLVAKR